jgi:hypothetical protein
LRRNLLGGTRGRLARPRLRMSRIYGKPTETVVTHTPGSAVRAVLASMTLEETLELLHSLRRGQQVALPVVEPVPPTG